MTQTPDLDKIKQTLIKVKELAERGEDGEKQVAQNKLKTLLDKYGIDISEIEFEKPIERNIKHHKDSDSRTILVQVIASVRKTGIFITKNKHLAHAELTYDEYIEVLEKYKYFWGLYKKQKHIFQQAFITRNGLYSKRESVCENPVEHEDSDEIVKMMMSLKKGEFGGDKQKKREQLQLPS